MFLNARRFGSYIVLMTLMLGLLAACGGSAGTASASPEDRVKSFMNDTMAALSDPKLNEQAKQDEWATKLSQYFVPEERDEQKKDMMDTLTQIGTAAEAKPSFKIEGLTTEKVSESGDTAEVKITGGKMTMSMAGQTEERDLSKENPFSASSANGNAHLKKIDGVWYFVDKSDDK